MARASALIPRSAWKHLAMRLGTSASYLLTDHLPHRSPAAILSPFYGFKDFEVAVVISGPDGAR